MIVPKSVWPGRVPGSRDSRDRGAPPQLANYRLVVEYDGGRYSGFQSQKNARTVAGELAASIGAVIGRAVTIIGAGRTDAGVHAEGQVVNFLASPGRDPQRLRDDVNERLPADINVVAVDLAPRDFHARSHATSRLYRYQILRRRDAFRKAYAWWVKQPIDFARVAAEAVSIVGQHDFASFTDETDVDTMVRIGGAVWSEAGDLLLFRVSADHFVYKMVRRLVGAMVEVGCGRARPGLLADLIAEPRFGATAEITAPPAGLFLERVTYPR